MRLKRRILALVLCTTLLLAGLPPAHAQETEFYHLRFGLETTSNFANLYIVSEDTIRATRVLEVWGDPLGWSGSKREMVLEREEPGAEMGMVMDVAFDAAALREGHILYFGQGEEGESWVTITQINAEGDTVGELAALSFDAPLAVPLRVGSAGIDPDALRVDEVPQIEVEPMVWAYYYAWFGGDEWNGDTTLHEPVTRYTSNDRAAITRQIEQAQRAGIDGFVVTFIGPTDPYTAGNINLLLEAAEVADFRVAVALESTDENGPRSDIDLRTSLFYVLRRFGDHPAYMRLGDRPVMWFNNPSAVELGTWREVFDTARNAGYDFVALAGHAWWSDALSVFDGLAARYPADPDDTLSTWNAGETVRTYPLWMNEPAPRLWVAAAWPGIDDSIYNDAPYVIPRDDGATFSITFATAMASQPDWIVINSWNDWWIDTQIEPTTDYGATYIRLSAIWSKIFHGDLRALPNGVWNATYYTYEGDDPPDFDDAALAIIRQERAISNEWGEGTPLSGLPEDRFMIRWVREIELDQVASALLVRASSDDGLRAWLDQGTPDERLILDRWEHRATPLASEIRLATNVSAGEHTLVVEYYEAVGAAEVTVEFGVLYQ